MSSAIDVKVQVSESSVFHVSANQSCRCLELYSQSRSGLETLSVVSSRKQDSSVNSRVPACLPEQLPKSGSLLDPQAPVFVPERSFGSEQPKFLTLCSDVDTQTLAKSPDGSSLTTLTIDNTSLVHAIKSLFDCTNVDDDVTLLKTKFYSGGNSLVAEVEVNEESGLPEHVHALFVQTFKQSDFPIESTDGLKQLLFDHRDTFASSSSDFGYCAILKHDIDTGDARPIRQSPRKPPLAARDAEDEILNDMLETGVIEPSNSSWASPICLVRKKDGTFRFSIDYRRVNAVSKKDAYTIPNIQDVLDNLRGAKYFATFDLRHYWLWE